MEMIFLICESCWIPKEKEGKKLVEGKNGRRRNSDTEENEVESLKVQRDLRKGN